MPFNLRLFHSGVGGMKNLFDKKVEDHKKLQLDNPFSEWEGATGATARRMSRDDENYGRPLPGSKSEIRAQVAQHHVMMEIKYLCEMIWDCAEWKSPDGRAAITFGKLFNLYNAISDKVVGTLLRARKHGYVFFEGEMLYQRRDDDKIIELARNINTILSNFGAKPLPTGGGPVELWNNKNEQQTQNEETQTTASTSGKIEPTQLAEESSDKISSINVADQENLEQNNNHSSNIMDSESEQNDTTCIEENISNISKCQSISQSAPSLDKIEELMTT